MVIRLFDHWQLPTEDRLALLGLSTGNRGALSRYRKGEPLAALSSVSVAPATGMRAIEL